MGPKSAYFKIPDQKDTLVTQQQDLIYMQNYCEIRIQ